MGILERGVGLADALSVEAFFSHPSRRLIGFLLHRLVFLGVLSEMMRSALINNSVLFRSDLQGSWFSYRFHRCIKFFSYATTSPSIFPLSAGAHVRARAVLHASERPRASGAAAGGVPSIPRGV